MVCFCSVLPMQILPIKATAELSRVSKHHNFWMNLHFEQIIKVNRWFNDPLIKRDMYFIPDLTKDSYKSLLCLPMLNVFEQKCIKNSTIVK